MSHKSPSLVITLFFSGIIAILCVDLTSINSKMEIINSSGDIQDLQDAETPVGIKLSGKYKRSFAYKTIKDRLPVILTKIIDNMSREKESIINKSGEGSSEELKNVIGNLSKLRSELMTNKPLSSLNLSNSEKDVDANIWNKRILDKEINESAPITWFTTDWLFSETYMYRRLSQIYMLTKTLSSVDYFGSQKESAFTNSLASITDSAEFTLFLLNKEKENYPEDEKKSDFITLLKMNLWGNRCDLSHSGGAAVNATKYCEVRDSLIALDSNLLIDDSLSVWNLLNGKKLDENVTIDIILDNSGYELMTDLCTAVFLTHHQLATKVRFYVKRIPWFVSDVTERDFHWMIESMKNSSNQSLENFGNLCDNYLKSNAWSLEVESFWTEPFDFSEMKNESPSLYSKLSEAKLLIFKGDLNYRKLLGDINWETTTDLMTALRGFKPSNLVTLRTLKADLCVGLAPEKAAEMNKIDEDWMVSGQYGVINSIINFQN